MKTALVIGANGQDGTFLVRYLLQREYRVIGIDMQPMSRWNLREEAFTYQSVDLRIYGNLLAIIRSAKPEFIFHVAAVHTSAGGTYETLFHDVLSVNVGSVHEVLEYLRERQDVRFIYASSCKVFGFPLPPVVNLETHIVDQDLYSISKNSAGRLIDYYRKQHGASATIVYLSNHESELRPKDFFIPTILKCLSSALKDKNHITRVNSLEFYCDWGSAEEYADIMIDILTKSAGVDFLLATGKSIYAREYVHELFDAFGLRYIEHIKERSIDSGQDQKPYCIDLSKLRDCIGRVPTRNIMDISRDILYKNYGLRMENRP
jgi:GDPmannose 4,6-dehydratase